MLGLIRRSHRPERPPRGARRGDRRGATCARADPPRAHARRSARYVDGLDERSSRRCWQALPALEELAERLAGARADDARLRGAGRVTFAALVVPNYRRYISGQSVSLIGTWMQMTAQSWLVLTLTHSSTALGLIVALQTLPVLLLGPYGGVIADRVDKRRLMVVLQSVMGVQALVLGLLTVTGVGRTCGRSACSPRCSASTTRSRTRRGSRSSSRSSARSTCATRSASTRCSSTSRARSARRSPAC